VRVLCPASRRWSVFTGGIGELFNHTLETYSSKRLRNCRLIKRTSPNISRRRRFRGNRYPPIAHQFGIGAMCARISEAILRDERVVLPVAAYRERYGVTIALPTVVGREGAAGDLEPSMSEDERRGFERSASTLRDAARSIAGRSG
jgi:hypothetical protein